MGAIMIRRLTADLCLKIARITRSRETRTALNPANFSSATAARSSTSNSVCDSFFLSVNTNVRVSAENLKAF